MTDDTVIPIITDLARKIFKQPSLVYTPEQEFRNIFGFDSVRAVEFILEIENALHVTLHEDEVDRMHTMGDLIATLRTK
jgi:acyl carrier protein